MDWCKWGIGAINASGFRHRTPDKTKAADCPQTEPASPPRSSPTATGCPQLLHVRRIVWYRRTARFLVVEYSLITRALTGKRPPRPSLHSEYSTQPRCTRASMVEAPPLRPSPGGPAIQKPPGKRTISPPWLSAKPTSCRIVGDKPLADAALAVDGGFGSWGSFIAGRKMAAAQIDITGDSPRGIGSGRSTAGALSSDISTSGLRSVSLTYRSKAGSGCWRDGSRST